MSDRGMRSELERNAWVEASIAARNERYARETKFCPACGGTSLGGVMGDRSLLACVTCGQRSPKYLLGREAIGG